MDSESWMGDLNLGEMFHNFPLDIHLHPYCGIDISPYLPEVTIHLHPYCGIDISPYLPEVTSWERWVRLMMGLWPSPYCSIKGFSWHWKWFWGIGGIPVMSSTGQKLF
jgi:hypothetical protein